MNSLPEADLILTVLRGEHTECLGRSMICPHLAPGKRPRWKDHEVPMSYFTGVSANHGEFRMTVGQCPRCGRVYGRKL